jgi:hypothetical protein
MREPRENFHFEWNGDEKTELIKSIKIEILEVSGYYE